MGFETFSLSKIIIMKNFKLYLENTLNTLKTTRVYFGVLQSWVGLFHNLGQVGFRPMGPRLVEQWVLKIMALTMFPFSSDYSLVFS